MTVTLHVAVLSPAVAVIVVSPIAIPLITPFSSTVAISWFSDDHSTFTSGSSVSTLAVRVVSPSSSISTELLLKLMELIGKDTVTSHVAFIEPAVAVMVAFPLLIAVTFPLSTLATLSSLDDHVMVLSSASLGSIVAVSVRTSLASIEAEVLSSLTDETPFGVTVTSQVAFLPLTVAVIVAVPTATAFTVPLFTVATEELELDQVTAFTTAFVGLTETVRLAEPPFAMESVDWLIETLATSTIGSSFGPHAARRSVKTVRISR